MPRKKSVKTGGRPTQLTEALFEKLHDAVLEGKSLKQFVKENGVKEDAVYEWSYANYLGFSDKVEGWRRDRKLMLAEKNIDEILEMKTTTRRIVGIGEDAELVETDDPQVLRVKADMSKFVAETLGKDKGYAKRNELSGPNGKPLIPVNATHKKKADKAINDFLTAGNP